MPASSLLASQEPHCPSIKNHISTCSFIPSDYTYCGLHAFSRYPFSYLPNLAFWLSVKCPIWSNHDIRAGSRSKHFNSFWNDKTEGCIQVMCHYVANLGGFDSGAYLYNCGWSWQIVLIEMIALLYQSVSYCKIVTKITSNDSNCKIAMAILRKAVWFCP